MISEKNSNNNYDVQLKNELLEFYSGKVFDIHAHIYKDQDINGVVPDINTWMFHMKELFEREPVGGLFMPYPASRCDILQANRFLATQLEGRSNSKRLLLVSPALSKDQFLRQLDSGPANIAGFKPYHIYSSHVPSMDSRIGDFIPEWVFEAADEKSLIIMLHLVKDKALSDTDNQKDIISKCTKYPGMKLILAHAARGFNPGNTIKGLKSLRGLENVYYDTSAICEPDALKAILHEFGPKKLLWGSDFPISMQKGKCVSVSDGFIWLDEAAFKDKMIAGSGMLQIGLESLAALMKACTDFGLKTSDKEDIFYNNSLILLGLKEKTKDKTQKAYDHAKTIIPGGTQLLSKRPEMFAPNQWPAYFSKARGCEVWDIDGKHYYDMTSNGIGSCLLGFCDPDVNSAVKYRIDNGSMSTQNPPEEIELAKLLCDIHPWAKKVRYTRSGGEACAVAVRIARASTGRNIVAVCGYHGWHDWYLSLNLGKDDALSGHLLPGLDPAGVPTGLLDTAFAFKLNDRKGFTDIIDKAGNDLAAVIMEPCRYHDPETGFLEFVKEKAHQAGALLIFDEITIGWRLTYGGAHLRLGIEPDMAVFAKALGNGYPIGAVIGTKDSMDGANRSFISSTSWTESIGPVAAIATLNKLKRVRAHEHAADIGSMIKRSWQKNALRHGIEIITDDGYPCLAHFSFKHEKSDALRTLYTQMMLDKGFLAACYIYPTMAHTGDIVERFDQAADEVFAQISETVRQDNIFEQLKGPVAHSGFRRLN